MIRLLVLHPTRMTCELFAAVLREEEDIEVAGFAHNNEDALKLLGRQSCDVVLVDVSLPNSEALSVARQISQKWENTKVLITGLVKSKTAILRCVEEGVAGYVLQEESLADLVKKIRAAHEDEFVVAPDVASMFMSRIAELKQMTKDLYGISTKNVGELFTELTPREWEVLRLIERGLSNQEIAANLVIEKGTVKNHVHNILSKLDVHCREQAATLARQMLANRSETTAISTEPLKNFPLAATAAHISQYSSGSQPVHLS